MWLLLLLPFPLFLFFLFFFLWYPPPPLPSLHSSHHLVPLPSFPSVFSFFFPSLFPFPLPPFSVPFSLLSDGVWLCSLDWLGAHCLVSEHWALKLRAMTLVLVPFTAALLSHSDLPSFSGQEMEAKRSDICLGLSLYPDRSDCCFTVGAAGHSGFTCRLPQPLSITLGDSSGIHVLRIAQ